MKTYLLLNMGVYSSHRYVAKRPYRVMGPQIKGRKIDGFHWGKNRHESFNSAERPRIRIQTPSLRAHGTRSCRYLERIVLME